MKKISIILSLGLLVIGLAGCGKTQEEKAQETAKIGQQQITQLQQLLVKIQFNYNINLIKGDFSSSSITIENEEQRAAALADLNQAILLSNQIFSAKNTEGIVIQNESVLSTVSSNASRATGVVKALDLNPSSTTVETPVESKTDAKANVDAAQDPTTVVAKKEEAVRPELEQKAQVLREELHSIEVALSASREYIEAHKEEFKNDDDKAEAKADELAQMPIALIPDHVMAFLKSCESLGNAQYCNETKQEFIEQSNRIAKSYEEIFNLLID